VNFRSHYYLSPSIITDAYFESLSRTSSVAEKHKNGNLISALSFSATLELRHVGSSNSCLWKTQTTIHFI